MNFLAVDFWCAYHCGPPNQESNIFQQACGSLGVWTSFSCIMFKGIHLGNMEMIVFEVPISHKKLDKLKDERIPWNTWRQHWSHLSFSLLINTMTFLAIGFGAPTTMVHTQPRMNIFNQACGNRKVCPRGREMRIGLLCNMLKVFTFETWR